MTNYLISALPAYFYPRIIRRVITKQVGFAQEPQCATSGLNGHIVHVQPSSFLASFRSSANKEGGKRGFSLLKGRRGKKAVNSTSMTGKSDRVTGMGSVAPTMILVGSTYQQSVLHPASRLHKSCCPEAGQSVYNTSQLLIHFFYILIMCCPAPLTLST